MRGIIAGIAVRNGMRYALHGRFSAFVTDCLSMENFLEKYPYLVYYSNTWNSLYQAGNKYRGAEDHE